MQDSQIINSDRYPLHQPRSAAYRELVATTRQRLEADGGATLAAFVQPQTCRKMAREAESLADLAYGGPTAVTPYYFDYRIAEGMDVDPEHPVRRKGRRDLRQVAGDLIPESHLLSILFRSPLMTRFLGDILGQTVYCNQDPYQSLNINLQEHGGCQQWHFDTAHMVTTLLLQAPEAGGEFEYVPGIRSEEDEHFEEVRKVLDGRSDRVRRLPLEAGMLSLFRGHYSIHRVTPVRGDRRRIQAILGYTTVPGLRGSIESSILHCGPRVAEREAQQG